MQDLDRLLVHFYRLGSLDLLLLSALNFDSLLLHSLLGKELLLVSNESLDVTRLLFFTVLVDFVAIRLTLGLITSRRLATHHALIAVLFLSVDAWRKTALLKFFACLLILSLAYLCLLTCSLVINLALTLSHIDLDFEVLVVLVHDHVVVWDEQVGTLLIVKLLHKLIVRVVEVLRALHLVTLDGIQLVAVGDRSWPLYLLALVIILCAIIFFGLFENAVGYAGILRRHVLLGRSLVEVHAGVLGTRLLDQLALTLHEVAVVLTSHATTCGLLLL